MIKTESDKNIEIIVPETKKMDIILVLAEAIKELCFAVNNKNVEVRISGSSAIGASVNINTETKESAEE